MFSEFLEELKEKNIEISFAHGKLNYSGPENNITSDLLERLKEFKPKLIKHFWPTECHNLMPINTEGDKIPFILVHGDQTNYSLSDYFGKDQPFYGFFHYGSDGTRIPHNSVKEFVDDYINQLQVVVPDGPYLLGGFSFGGVLAFQIAVELQHRGYRVPLLVLIDCRNPDQAFNEPSKSVETSLFTLHKKIADLGNKIWLKIYYKGLKMFFRANHLLRIPLPDKKRNRYIATKYRDIMIGFKPVRPFKGDILYFRATENPSVHKYMGWENLCDNIEMITIKGNHDTIKKNEESIQSLRENIHSRLIAVQKALTARPKEMKTHNNATVLQGKLPT